MERDMQLIRAILEFAERNAGNKASGVEPDLPYPAEKVHYHISLCDDAGFIVAKQLSPSMVENYYSYRIIRLTWQGHEQLDQWRCR